MKRQLAAFLLACAGWTGAAIGAGTEPAGNAVTDDPDWKAGKAAIDAKNWKGAVDAFGKVAKRHADSADTFNWLGYAYRKSGDLDNAFRNYDTALRLDPKHLGAHEYIGEAFLMKKDLAGAETHLKDLERLCGKRCEEYEDLAKSITEFRSKTGSAK